MRPLRDSPVLFLTADGNTCLFHELTPWRSYHIILRCISAAQCITVQHITSVLVVWSLLAPLLAVYPGLNLHSVQACLYSNSRRTRRGVHTSPGASGGLEVSLLRFVPDQRLRIESKGGICARVYDRVCEVVFVCGWAESGEFEVTYLPLL